MDTLYETIRVKFSQSIESINEEIFKGKENIWGVASLKEWTDGYESTRFTPISETEAIITSEYNMTFVKRWLINNFLIASIEIL